MLGNEVSPPSFALHPPSSRDENVLFSVGGGKKKKKNFFGGRRRKEVEQMGGRGRRRLFFLDSFLFSAEELKGLGKGRGEGDKVFFKAGR